MHCAKGKTETEAETQNRVSLATILSPGVRSKDGGKSQHQAPIFHLLWGDERRLPLPWTEEGATAPKSQKP